MYRLSDPTLKFVIPSETLARTLLFLQAQGRKGHEGVVLWPGRLADGACFISRPIIPRQITGRLYYRIPDDETFRIVREVAEQELVIPIQVHSHPKEAFHSPVDDELAFVQHENAISIVVPEFGTLSSAEFPDRARFYRLHAGNEWVEMTTGEARAALQFETL